MRTLAALPALALAPILGLSACASSSADGPAPRTAPSKESAMNEIPPDGIRIQLTSVLVDDQAKAQAFYTEKLGFEVVHDTPMGEHRWLTVTSPAGVEGVELLLEPNAHPASRTFQEALRRDGIPLTSFFVADVDATFERLRARGVTFRGEPVTMGGARVAILDDTCGNWIGLAQVFDQAPEHEPEPE